MSVKLQDHALPGGRAPCCEQGARRTEVGPRADTFGVRPLTPLCLELSWRCSCGLMPPNHCLLERPASLRPPPNPIPVSPTHPPQPGLSVRLRALATLPSQPPATSAGTGHGDTIKTQAPSEAKVLLTADQEPSPLSCLWPQLSHMQIAG